LEYWVQQALNHLMTNRTTICIAYRLSTIEKAERIYVIEEGEVIEQGNHTELLDMSSKYKLYETQFAKIDVS
jgi:ABC-type multidrug transport system fused ATPase/permease subunit